MKRFPAKVAVTSLGLPASEVEKFRSSNALTSFNPKDGTIDIWLSLEIVEPLLDLNGDLNSAERLATQFRVAIIVVHELMHTFFNARYRYYGHNNLLYREFGEVEPFFMDEPLSEAGWSADNAVSTYSLLHRALLTHNQVFGGLTLPFIMAPKPPLALYQHNYPRPGLGLPLQLTWPHFPTTQIISPLPVTFYESLQSEEFWAARFPSYGYGLLRLKPVSSSWKWMNGPDNSWKLVNAEDLEKFSEPHPTGKAVATLLELTPAERLEQARQMRSNAVQTLQEQINYRRERVTDLLAEAEVCARFMGKPEYINLLMNMVQMLERMVTAHQTVVELLLEFENDGHTSLVGKYTHHDRSD
jgi:hypothetical protein